jgi:hypothetical protein
MSAAQENSCSRRCHIKTHAVLGALLGGALPTPTSPRQFATAFRALPTPVTRLFYVQGLLLLTVFFFVIWSFVERPNCTGSEVLC